MYSYISSVSILAVFILYFTWPTQYWHSLNTILTSMSLFHAVNLMGQFYPNRTIFLRYEPFESSTQTSFLTFGKFRFQDNVRGVATIPEIPFSLFLGVVFTWPVMASTSAKRLLPFYLTWSSTYSLYQSGAQGLHICSPYNIVLYCCMHLTPGLPPCSGPLAFHCTSPHCVLLTSLSISFPLGPMSWLQCHFTDLH